MFAYKTSQLACHHCTSNRSRCSSRRSKKALRPCAIGFDLTGSTTSVKSAEKCADELSRKASSLFIYRGVLSTPPARSFMDVLLHLQKGSPNKLLEHYGELYKFISNEGFRSWEDYLLDQVLRGTDNPFSKASARNESVAHLLPSVSHDMAIIKELSVSEATLASWVRETVSSVSDDWMIAATALSNATIEDNHASNGENVKFEVPHDPPIHILAPLTKSQRTELRSRLSREQQAEATAVLLQRYHAAHDYGILSVHRVLKWNQDRLQAQDVLEGISSSNIQSSGEIEKGAADVLVAAIDSGLLRLDLTNRKQGCDPIVIEGCSRNAYALAMRVLNNLQNLVSPDTAVAAEGIRVIIMPHSQLSTISELAWTMSQHPRMYFAVVCPGVPTEISSDVAATIAGGDGVSWPSNSLFIGCCDTAPALKKVPGVRIAV